MNRIFEAALDIQDNCLSHGWRFCIIGAVAVQRWGEPRLTRDLLIRTASGVPVDVALGAMPFEERAVARLRPLMWARGARS